MKLIALTYLLFFSLLSDQSKQAQRPELMLKQCEYKEWVSIRDYLTSHNKQKYSELSSDSFLKQFQIEVVPAGKGTMEYSGKILTLNRYAVTGPLWTCQDSMTSYLLSSEKTAQNLQKNIDLESVVLNHGRHFYFFRIGTYIGINPEDEFDITDRTYNFILMVKEE